MSKELISVIIPVHNTAEYLDECISSIIKQTYSNIEIIIVNDGSTDNSEQIILKYKKNDDRIKYYHKSSTGCGDSRNYGLDRAKGKYIYFLDSDDYVSPNLLEKLYNAIKPNDSFSGFLNVYMIFDNEIKLFKRNENEQIYLKYPAVWSRLYNKKILDESKIRFSDVVVGEDLEFNCKLILFNNKFTYINDALYYYRIRQDSTIHNKKTNKLAVLKAIDYIEEYAKINNKKSDFHKLLEFISICHILRVVKELLSQKEYNEEELIKAINCLTKRYPDWISNPFSVANLQIFSKSFM